MRAARTDQARQVGKLFPLRPPRALRRALGKSSLRSHRYRKARGGFRREVQPRRQHWFLNEKSGFPFRTPAFCSVSRGQRRLGEKEYRAPSVTPGVALRPRTQGAANLLSTGISHPTCNQTPANITNTIDINLGLGDTPRDFQRLSFGPGTCNFERDRFDLRGEHGVRRNRNVQAVPQSVICRAGLAGRRLRPSARFRVETIGAVLVLGGQGGDPPPISPVSRTGNPAF